MIGIFINPIVGVLTIASSWVIDLANYSSSTQTNVIFLVVFVAIIFYWIVSLILKKYKSIAIVLSIIFQTVGLILIYYFITPTRAFPSLDQTTNLYGVLWSFLSLSLLSIAFAYITSVVNSAFQLNIVNIYVYEKFIRSSLAFTEIEKFINIKNVTAGFFVTFGFEALKTLEIKHGTRAKQSFLNELRHELGHTYSNDDILLFEITKDQYGLFKPIENLSNVVSSEQMDSPDYHLKNDNFLLLLEQSALNIKKKIQKNENKYKSINPRCVVSYYGVHSNSLEELETYNQKNFLQKPDSTKCKHVSIFNPKIWNEGITESKKFSALSNLFPIRDLQVEYMPVVSSVNSKIIFYNSRYYISKMNRFSNVKELFDYVYDKFLYDTMLRYFAGLSINQYVLQGNTKQPLAITYDAGSINNEWFNPHSFVERIRNFGINPSKIMIDFNCEHLSSITNTLLEKIKTLNENKIRIILSNFDYKSKKHHELLPKIQPAFVLFKPYTINAVHKDRSLLQGFKISLDNIKKNKIETALINIDTHTLLITAMKLDVSLLCGEYIGKNIFAQDVSETVQAEISEF